MVDTAERIDFAERLRSLSTEPSGHKERNGPSPLSLGTAPRRPAARRPIALALAVAVMGGAGYVLTTDIPLAAALKEKAGTLLAAVTEPAAEPAVPPPAAFPAASARIVATATPPSIIGSGYSRAERDVVLTASAAGRIIAMDVTEGAAVTAGSVLLKLDDRLAREELRRALLELQSMRLDRDRADLALTRQRSDTERVRKLVKKGAVPRKHEADAGHDLARRELDLKQAEIAVRLAVAGRDTARARLKDYVLLAPFDGRVAAVGTQTGQLALGDPGEALVRIFDPASLIVEVDVDDRNLNVLKPGQPAELVFDAWADAPVPGTVLRISPMVSRDRGTVRVAIAPDRLPAEIRPNMAVRATIAAPADPVRLSFDQENSHE